MPESWPEQGATTGTTLMDPRPATDAEAEFWTERDGQPVKPYVLGGPEEGDDVIPCPTLIAVDAPSRCHVAYQLNELELAALAQGGTLWLTTWGMLPVHLIEVVPKEPTPELRCPHQDYRWCDDCLREPF